MGNQLAVAMASALSLPEQELVEVPVESVNFKYQKFLREDGHIAVLYAPGFGAGWWTWNTEYLGLLFDADIVQAVLDKDFDRIPWLVNNRYPGAYLGGMEDLEVGWVPSGGKFEIREYDGSESLRLADEIPWHIA
jgi:hypothetical protein